MLKLEESGTDLWERFLAGAIEPEERRFPVVSCWERALSLGAKADGPGDLSGVGDADLRERRERLLEACTEAAQWVMRLASQTVTGGFRAVLTDADGVVLLAQGGESLGRHSAHARLVEGARWNELARGTNAIGTALAEGKPVAVLGRGHLEQRNHGLACYAAPLRNAFGELVGTLDLTGAVERAHGSLEALLLGTAQGAEHALREQVYRELLLSRTRSGSTARATLLIESPGRVALVGDSAAKQLGLGRGQLVGQGVEQALGVPWRQLVEASLRGEVLRVGGRGPSLRAEPHLDSAGRVFALNVWVEAQAPARPPWVEPPAFARILGHDAQLGAAKALAAKVAPSMLPVMLLAETGTGKELLAAALHASSTVARGPFIALNCGALSPALLESELFGYAPGAFTGALPGGSVGKLGAADGGTLFLDEVGEMPEALQAMLLRVLEDGQYFRLGESRPRHSTFRLVCATCRDLPGMVQDGRFRCDLYFRIRGATLRLPALRDRSDLLELAQGLLAVLCAQQARDVPSLHPAVSSALGSHPWPGNVRELKMALSCALVLASGEAELRLEHLPAELVPRARSMDAAPLKSTMEGSALRRALEGADGNLSQAARVLGVARSTLYRMMRRHGFQTPGGEPRGSAK